MKFKIESLLTHNPEKYGENDDRAEEEKIEPTETDYELADIMIDYFEHKQ